jgi:hypothetical protein
MAKARKRKLKVFQARFGFHDSVVAAPSQAAALLAWGTHQNLFADGQARIATDARAVEAALAHPEIPLRRPLGSDDAFALEPASLPKVPDAPKKVAARPAAKPRAASPRPPADRAALDAAQSVLRQLDDRRKREEAEFRRREEALGAERGDAQQGYVEARKVATAAVGEARKAYRLAGGRD